jgi:hypothetical protein
MLTTRISEAMSGLSDLWDQNPPVSMEKDGPRANGYVTCPLYRAERLTAGNLPREDLDYRHVTLENGHKGIVRYWRGAFHVKAL